MLRLAAGPGARRPVPRVVGDGAELPGRSLGGCGGANASCLHSRSRNEARPRRVPGPVGIPGADGVPPPSGRGGRGPAARGPYAGSGKGIAIPVTGRLRTNRPVTGAAVEDVPSPEYPLVSGPGAPPRGPGPPNPLVPLFPSVGRVTGRQQRSQRPLGGEWHIHVHGEREFPRIQCHSGGAGVLFPEVPPRYNFQKDADSLFAPRFSRVTNVRKRVPADVLYRFSEPFCTHSADSSVGEREPSDGSWNRTNERQRRCTSCGHHCRHRLRARSPCCPGGRRSEYAREGRRFAGVQCQFPNLILRLG